MEKWIIIGLYLLGVHSHLWYAYKYTKYSCGLTVRSNFSILCESLFWPIASFLYFIVDTLCECGMEFFYWVFDR